MRAYNMQMVTVIAHFDGKVIVPDEPTGLTPGARLRVTLEAIDGRAAQTTDPAVRHFRPLNIRVAPELSNAIATDPSFDVQES